MAALSRVTTGQPTLFGTAYYPDHWPEADWARDLAQIREAGIRLVRFGEFSWSWFEPQPGEFHWAAYDRFVELAHRLGLQLCLCTPTATPPPWFDRLYPEGRMQNMHGQKCLSHRHYWGWHEPQSRAHAARTLTALAQRYGQHPAVVAWQIDNELNYAEQVHADAEKWYDFSPSARRAWVAWLQARYGTLEALNEAWFTAFWSQRYGHWDELALVRGRANPGMWLDFLRFREAHLANVIGWQRDLLRAHCRPGVKIGTNIPETGVPFSLVIGQDYFAQAAGLDWVGTDLYEASGDRAKDLRTLAYRTDLMRAAAGRAAFYLSETQAGPHERAWPNGFAGEGFGPDYLEQCADTYLRHGAEQVWWFLWRPTLGGHEIGMNGVQDLAGDNTARTALVRELAEAGARGELAARRADHLQRPLVRLGYSRDSLRARHAWAGAEKLGEVEDCLCGWHGLLEALGYRVDLVPDADLAAALRDAATPIVLAHHPLLPTEAVGALTTRRGPTVVGPLLALADEHARLLPGRLAAPLRAAWAVAPGLYRDLALPTVPGWPAPRLWREQTATGPLAQPLRSGDVAVGISPLPQIALLSADLGELWTRATAAERAALQAFVAGLLR